MPKTDVKRGRGIASRREQVFFVLGRCLGYGGSLPVPHRIIGKIWKADNLLSISLALGYPNKELHLRSVEFSEFFKIPLL